ncbi:SDR family NAD(P)-dependent oxidoreductase [Polaromonas naphthalenivorans]|uniref:Short-chain dehydrogenase/reductase SDR n=1 Tax=Polaromonas naphthalenivorans (strain CJ2) TaxID=365044 RepID=A1VQU4_POLNA|nr:SDR family NAD(P)-dependent oxidoreductase [Polaromonas naphthalenivorans]ABM38022.1 short-chain dehydrogenase/reductase SDR [Polaromonas naphthalenivorans CJ2]
MTSPSSLHALVTGATGGIGRGICLALIEQARKDGAAIHIAAAASQSGDKLESLLGELRAAGATASGVTGDITDPAQCAALVAQAQASGGDLTALVCNAGASGPGQLADLPVAQWDTTFNLNTRSAWLLAQAARDSLARTRGSITAIASMSGLTPHPGYGAYSAAKAALIMLCRQLAQEWAADGIRVNTVCPGMIRTPLTEAVYQDADTLLKRQALVPLGRIGRAEDVGAAVAFLASAGASYITGQNLVVDGGISDHMLAMIPGRPGKPPVGLVGG